MKKLFAISIAGLVAVLTLGACKPTVQPAADTLTYEQILDLPKVCADEKRFIYDNFLEVWDLCENVNNNLAVVKCEVLAVDYYYGRTVHHLMKGHTMAEVRVIEVVDDYNTAQVKPGQIVKLRQFNYIDFENVEDDIAFFSENLGKPISNLEELDAAGGVAFKLVPVKGVEYRYHMSANEYPLKAGESYTMFIDAQYAKDGSIEYYFTNYIMPLNSKVSVTEFAKEHGFVYYDDVLKIAEEIAEMFK